MGFHGMVVRKTISCLLNDESSGYLGTEYLFSPPVFSGITSGRCSCLVPPLYALGPTLSEGLEYGRCNSCERLSNFAWDVGGAPCARVTHSCACAVTFSQQL